MQHLLEAETRVREAVRKLASETKTDARQQADMIAGDVAAQVYHYLLAVAHYELCVTRARHSV
jgi:hypothetical protein